MKFSGRLSLLVPLALVAVMVALAYGNVAFLHRSLNPVLLIPEGEIRLATGYADIAGNTDGRHGWHVDLANPAYLEWPVNLQIGQALKAGHIPLMMPYQNLGIPLVGQYCHRVYSPYQMVANLFYPRGYDFFILLRLVLAGVFTYLFLRPLCRHRASALVGAAGFGLGSIMVIYSNHEEVSNVAMMVPILIWAVRAFFDRPGVARGCWLALALGLVHTAGQPEIQLYVLLLALVYGLARLFSLPRDKRAGPFWGSLGAIVLSGLISAPQIVLFLRYLSEVWTYHPPGGTLGLQSPMTPANFVFTFFPRLRLTPWPWAYRTVNLLWDWVGGYFGLGLLVLAGAAARRPGRHRRDILAFGLYFLFILAKNFGWSPAQLIGLLPFFDQTWTPRWSAASWSFALAVLAGLGLDSLLSPDPEPAPAPRDTARGKAAFLSNPLAVSGLLLLGLILSLVFWLQGSAAWKAAQLRSYTFYHGFLFFFLAGSALLAWRLLGNPIREYLGRNYRAWWNSFSAGRFEVVGLLAAAACLTLRWFPARHHQFQFPEPFGSYLLAAPVFLAALVGLFVLAASPSGYLSAAAAAVAIPLALVGGWAELPPGPLPDVWRAVFGLNLAAFLFLPAGTRLRKILPPILSGLLLAGLAAAALLSEYFSPQADVILRWQLLFAVLALAFFSWLALRVRREGPGSGLGWLFLLAVWAELAIYIPRNHFERFFLIGNIPFLAAGAVVAAAVLLKRSLSPARFRAALAAAGLAIGGSVILVIDLSSAPRLPRQSVPSEPLPFVRFLQERRPHAITGVGRVLAPNFASAHGLYDMRGCVSMNILNYQIFWESVLQVVPPASSYSLWYTGDNPISHGEGSPYGSSQAAHVRAFERGFNFFRLAGARYVVSPRGALDRAVRSAARSMMKIYAEEVDIWEIPALPPAFIARRAEVIPMEEDLQAWGRAVTERPEVLRGELVLLEKEPETLIPAGGPLPSDRAELIAGDNPNRFQVRFHSETPGYLVVNRLHTNLLRASLEGRDLPVIPANGPFFAVPVPGGDRERTLEITYVSSAVHWSYLLALAGLGALLAGLATAGLGKRRPRHE